MTIWAIYIGWALLIASGLLLRLLIGPRCPHGWELVDKTEFHSQMEEARKFGYKLTAQGQGVDDATRRSATIVLRCPKCGAAKVLKVTSE